MAGQLAGKLSIIVFTCLVVGCSGSLDDPRRQVDQADSMVAPADPHPSLRQLLREQQLTVEYRGELCEGRRRVCLVGYDDVPHRYGYVDERERVVIEPQFLNVGDFSQNRATFRRYGGQKRFPGNHYASALHPVGYIDRNGQVVIEPRFRYAQKFSDSRAAFTDASDKCGYIDLDGNVVIPARYDSVQPFQDGRAFVLPDRKTECEPYVVTEEQAAAYNQGKFRLPNMARPRAGTYYRRVDKGLWGLIDINGQYIVEPRFQRIHSFRNGRARVQIEERWTFIDRDGNEVSDPPVETQ